MRHFLGLASVIVCTLVFIGLVSLLPGVSLAG
ncbi:MAG: twin-arginine translocation signal domain-containing protein [Candidatus Kaiserbacteria bacterium]|nr:MAG: twin-arginine translocation signal domain-containing protein [Candidatus Kaiserbacteria bacterium]